MTDDKVNGMVFQEVTERVIDHVATGKKVRDARESVHLKLDALASAAGVSKQYLSDLELGKKNWTKERYERIMALITPPPPKEYVVIRR